MDSTTDAVFHRANCLGVHHVSVGCPWCGILPWDLHVSRLAHRSTACISRLPTTKGDRRRGIDAGVLLIQEGTAPKSRSDHRSDVE